MFNDNRVKELYLDNKRGIYHFILKLIRDPDSSEDILQDCFLNLMRYAEKYDIIDKNIRSFLYKSARNLCINYIKKKNCLEFVSISEVEMDNFVLNIKDTLVPENEADIFVSLLTRRLIVFNEVFREIFFLKIIYRMSDIQIAEKMNISSRTVRRRINEMKTYLKVNYNYNNFLESA